MQFRVLNNGHCGIKFMCQSHGCLPIVLTLLKSISLSPHLCHQQSTKDDPKRHCCLLRSVCGSHQVLETAVCNTPILTELETDLALPADSGHACCCSHSIFYAHKRSAAPRRAQQFDANISRLVKLLLAIQSFLGPPHPLDEFRPQIFGFIEPTATTQSLGFLVFL